MSPRTGNQLSHHLQSHGWWYILGLWLRFLSFVSAFCFMSWHSEWIRTPTAHRSVASRPVSDMCSFVIISISDLLTLWLHNRKKIQRILSFFFWRGRNRGFRNAMFESRWTSASTKSMTKKEQQLTVKSAPLCSNSRSESRWLRLINSLDLWSPLCFGHECEFFVSLTRRGYDLSGVTIETLLLSNMSCGPSLYAVHARTLCKKGKKQSNVKIILPAKW